MTPAERMMILFQGNRSSYGTHGVPELKGNKWEIKSTARHIRGGVTIALWNMHLAGETPLGIVPITNENTCYWGSIDVDDYVNDLLSLINRVEQLHLPLIPCRSKSGGVHLFLFSQEAAPALAFQTALKNIAALIGVSGAEIFPKQVQLLVERGDLGNWMVMPYFGGTYDGKLREQIGLRRTGAELTIEQFLNDSEAAKVSIKQIEVWARSANPKSRKVNGEATLSTEDFDDGPVCLQILARTKIQQGGQNNALLMMGIYYKKKNALGWKIDLAKANQNLLNPPGITSSLNQVIKSLQTKEYNYTCKTQPMCDHCNASLCRTRKYGVGHENDFPPITGLSLLKAKASLWLVDIEDRRLEVSTDDLFDYGRFMKICMEEIRVYQMMSQKIWMDILRPLRDNCNIIDAPPEITRAGQFAELLEEFCTNKQKGKDKQSILIGRPWENEEEGRYYFRLQDFHKFMLHDGVKDFTRAQLSQNVKNVGGGKKLLSVTEKRTVRCWFVPSSMFTVHEPVETPKLEEDNI